MKAYQLDFSSWEEGVIIEVQATSVPQALEKGCRIARQKGYEGDAVQMYQLGAKKGQKRLVWDFMSGTLP